MITRYKYLLSLVILLLVGVSQAQQQYNYQAVTRNIITASQYCSSAAKCNIIGSGASYHQLVWNVIGTLSACAVQVDSSADGITWNSGDIIATQVCTSNGQTISTAHTVNYVRVNVTTITPVSTATLTVQLTGFQNLPSGGGTITSIATTSPITGGPITSTGTLACPTCTTAQANGIIKGQYMPTKYLADQMPNAAEVGTFVTTTQASPGTVELYTVPANRKALVYKVYGLNTQTQNVTGYVSIAHATGGPYFRVSSSSSIFSLGSAVFFTSFAIILDPGEVVAFTATTLTGTGTWWIKPIIYEFDSSSPLRSIKLFAPTANTEILVGTVPAGKFWIPFNPIEPASATLGGISCEGGTNPTYVQSFQKSGVNRTTPAAITNFSLTTNVATYTVANAFNVGDIIGITPITDACCSFAGQRIVSVASSNGTSFTAALTHANVVSSAVTTGLTIDGRFWDVGTSGTCGAAGTFTDPSVPRLIAGDSFYFTYAPTIATLFIWFNILELPVN